MAIKIPQTRIIKKLGLSTVVAWDLSNCVSVEEVNGAALDISGRKVLPTHIKVSTDHDVTLPEAKLQDGRAITVKNASGADVVVGGVTILAATTDPVVIYSNGTAWVSF